MPSLAHGCIQSPRRRHNRLGGKHNLLTSPRSLSIGAADVQTGSKLCEERRWQSFGEDVGILRGGWNMKNSNSTKSNMFLNKMEINLDVFSPLMLDWVGGHVDGADVVTGDQCSTLQGGL